MSNTVKDKRAWTDSFLYRFFLCMFVLLSMLVISCKRPSGHFAFRFPPEEKYRLISTPIELSDRDKVEWIYEFKKFPGSGKVGVIFLKKELVPVEVFSAMENVTADSPFIYGTIQDMVPGVYRIVLTDVIAGNNLIDEREFTVYSSEENNDLPLD